MCFSIFLRIRKNRSDIKVFIYSWTFSFVLHLQHSKAVNTSTLLITSLWRPITKTTIKQNWQQSTAVPKRFLNHSVIQYCIKYKAKTKSTPCSTCCDVNYIHSLSLSLGYKPIHSLREQRRGTRQPQKPQGAFVLFAVVIICVIVAAKQLAKGRRKEREREREREREKRMHEK